MGKRKTKTKNKQSALSFYAKRNSGLACVQPLGVCLQFVQTQALVTRKLFPVRPFLFTSIGDLLTVINSSSYSLVEKKQNLPLETSYSLASGTKSFAYLDLKFTFGVFFKLDNILTSLRIRIEVGATKSCQDCKTPVMKRSNGKR